MEKLEEIAASSKKSRASVKDYLVAVVLSGFLVYSLGATSRDEEYAKELRQIQKIEKIKKDPRYIIYKTVKKAEKFIYEHLSNRLFF